MRAKRLITDGEIGRIISAHVHFGEYLPAWHPWEDYRKGYAARADLGGGVVRTQSHALDYLPWLVGKVESVWGFTARLSDLEVDVDDTAKIGLRFENKALGSLHLDYNQQPPSHHFEIIGTQGSLQWDLSDGAVRIYRALLPPVKNSRQKENGRTIRFRGLGTECHVHGRNASLYRSGTESSTAGLFAGRWRTCNEIDQRCSGITKHRTPGQFGMITWSHKICVEPLRR